MSEGRAGTVLIPVLLIATGFIFLLNTTGVVDWAVWAILWRLWPVLFIALGLELLLGRTRLGRLLSILLVVSALVSGLWAALSGGVGTWGRHDISQRLQGAERAEVTVRMRAGRLRLEALTAVAASDLLLEGEVVSSGPVQQEYRIENETAYLELGEEASRGIPFFFWWGPHRQAANWTVRLQPAIPLALRVDAGAGEAVLDLSRLRIEALDVHTGVGQTTLMLPQRGRVSGRVRGGVGETVVHIPEGMAARVRIESGLGQSEIEGNFLRGDGVYVTPGYEQASDRIDLHVSAGVGQIVVKQLASPFGSPAEI